MIGTGAGIEKGSAAEAHVTREEKREAGVPPVELDDGVEVLEIEVEGDNLLLANPEGAAQAPGGSTGVVKRENCSLQRRMGQAVVPRGGGGHLIETKGDLSPGTGNDRSLGK